MKIPSSISQAFATATDYGHQAKSGIMWFGHVLKKDYLIPGVEKLVSCALRLFAFIKEVLMSGPKGLFPTAATLLLMGVFAFKMANRKDYEEDMVAKTAWKTAGMIAFMGSVALTTFGLVTLV